VSRAGGCQQNQLEETARLPRPGPVGPMMVQ
jgi:hypothetical protein